MQFKAPDDVEVVVKEDNVEEKASTKENDDKFVKVVQDILEMPEISPKFIVSDIDYSSSSQYQLEVVKKFTALCREEVLPRHHKAAETIDSKSQELYRMQLVQQKDVAQLHATVKELTKSREQLRVKIEQTQASHQVLEGRLTEVLNVLKNYCKNKTVAERKMAQDLLQFEKRSKDLKVNMTATKAKVNYYASQMNAQTEEVAKHTKPLYLDKNRAVFMRSNLNSMRENIEQLVSRVKSLNCQMTELELEPKVQED